jgi:non-ribosomal peptide synthetase component F
VARLRWAHQRFGGLLSGVLAATSVCFDLSVFEIFGTLTWGGTVLLADSALELATLPARAEVTLVNTVPSAMAELVRQQAVAGIDTVNLAGEALPRELVDAVSTLSLTPAPEHTRRAMLVRVEL